MDNYCKRERIFVGIFLLLLSFMVARSLRHNWLDLCNGHCAVNLGPPPPAPAPEAYRIAIPAIERAINIVFHLKDATLSRAAIDFVSGFFAFFCLYRVTVDGLLPTKDGIALRMAALGILLGYLQFPIGFIYFLQRPGTLLASCFIAVALLSLTRATTHRGWIAVLFLATAFQAFARADVPFVFGLALILLSYCGNLLEDFGSRRFNLLLGIGITLIAGCIQLYLQFVLLPHLPYATGSPIVIEYNARWNIFNVFLLAIVPFVALIFPAVKRRRRLSSVEVMALGAAVLYLPLWFTVGFLSEVRIYVPFLMALCVVAARVWASYLLPDGVPGSGNSDAPDSAQHPSPITS